MTKIIYVDFKNKIVVGRETLDDNNSQLKVSKAAPVKIAGARLILGDETMESILKDLEREYSNNPKK